MGAFSTRLLEPLSAFEASPQRDEKSTGSRVSATALFDETLLDALAFLSRADLDAAQIANRRLRKLVHELRFVCLRPLEMVSFRQYRNRMTYELDNWFVARIQIEWKPPTTQDSRCLRIGMPEDETRLKSDDKTLCFDSELAVDVVAWLLTRLQSACVSEFSVEGLTLLWPIVELFKEQACTIFVKKRLSLASIDACSKAWFAVLESFGGFAGLVTASGFVSTMNDEFIRIALRKGAHVLSFSEGRPKHALAYRISEDAILEFCFDERQHGRQVELTLYHPTVSPQFFARLVEASLVCRSEAVMQVLVYVDQPHNQDTTAYAGNLKQLHNCELFDFPGEVHSQIQLYNVPHSTYACIELHRAKADATGACLILEF